MRGKSGPKPGPKKPNSRGKTLNAKDAQAEAKAAAAEKTLDLTIPVPSDNDVVNLARRCKSMQKQARETSGQIGEMIAKAVESKSLDRKAFSMARQLDGMSQEKLRVTYFHLIKYMDALGIVERATAQAEMFDQDGEEGGEVEEASGEEGGEGKVVRPKSFREAQLARNGANQDRSSAPLPREVGESAGAAGA